MRSHTSKSSQTKGKNIGKKKIKSSHEKGTEEPETMRQIQINVPPVAVADAVQAQLVGDLLWGKGCSMVSS